MRSLVVAFLMLAAAQACARRENGPAKAETPLVTVTDEHFTNEFTRNFNPFSPRARWPTASGVYEPLLVYNFAKGSYRSAAWTRATSS
jgi:peptide/nickel transport system substrate-binding protein